MMDNSISVSSIRVLWRPEVEDIRAHEHRTIANVFAPAGAEITGAPSLRDISSARDQLVVGLENSRSTQETVSIYGVSS